MLQVVGKVRHDHWGSRECDCDPGANLELGVLCGQDEWHERLVWSFEREASVEAGFLELSSSGAYLIHVGDQQSGVDLHAFAPP